LNNNLNVVLAVGTILSFVDEGMNIRQENTVMAPTSIILKFQKTKGT